MSAYDLVNNIKVVFATAEDGDVIDTLGFESLTVAAASGTITLTECDTANGTFTTVSDEDLIKPAKTAAPAAAVKVGYRGHKQFVKVKIAKDSAISATVSAVVILGNARHKAVA